MNIIHVMWRVFKNNKNTSETATKMLIFMAQMSLCLISPEGRKDNNFYS